MYLKNLRLRNFAKFADFAIEFGKERTDLVGVNGSGKTTIGLTAIWVGLKGISESPGANGYLAGERSRFIGVASKTSDVDLTIIDEKTGAEIAVRNHLSASGNKITFKAPEGVEMGTGWLKDLLSVAFLSAKNFGQLNPKEQALLLGIDTEAIDKEIEDLKTEATALNRELNAFGEIVFPEEVEEVKVIDLVKEKDAIEAGNRAEEAKATAISDADKLLRDITEAIIDKGKEIAAIEEDIVLLRSREEKGHFFKAHLDEPGETQSTEAISKRIENAEEDNKKAAAYTAMKEKSEKKETKRGEVQKNTDAQDRKKEERLKYITEFKFGFDQLSVDEKGGLLLDNRPVREPYFSKVQMELIAAKLYVSKNPEFKVRFIDDFESFDEENQEKIVRELGDAGIQIITASVGKKKKNEDTVLLRECKAVETYEEKSE